MTQHDQLVFDAHSDLPFRVVREREAGRRAVIETDFLPGMKDGGITMRLAAVYIDDAYLPEMALHRALVVISELHKDVEESDGVDIATGTSGLREARENVTLLLGMEGAEPLMDDPRLLDAFYRSGIRLLTLTHSRRNAVGEGAPLSSTHAGTPGGLSKAGIEVLHRAESLGVIVDVSHLNAPGFEDAVTVTDAPLVASHSNSRALCDHPRNLTDEQIRMIAGTGGVVCITAVGSFLASESSTLGDFCDHIEHAVNLVGVDHVGLGFDFCEYMLEYLSEQERQRFTEISTVDELNSDSAVALVPPALRDRGFSTDEIAAICHTNLLEMFKQVLE